MQLDAPCAFDRVPCLIQVYGDVQDTKLLQSRQKKEGKKYILHQQPREGTQAGCRQRKEAPLPLVRNLAESYIPSRDLTLTDDERASASRVPDAMQYTAGPGVASPSLAGPRHPPRKQRGGIARPLLTRPRKEPQHTGFARTRPSRVSTPSTRATRGHARSALHYSTGRAFGYPRTCEPTAPRELFGVGCLHVPRPEWLLPLPPCLYSSSFGSVSQERSTLSTRCLLTSGRAPEFLTGRSPKLARARPHRHTPTNRVASTHRITWTCRTHVLYKNFGFRENK